MEIHTIESQSARSIQLNHVIHDHVANSNTHAKYIARDHTNYTSNCERTIPTRSGNALRSRSRRNRQDTATATTPAANLLTPSRRLPSLLTARAHDDRHTCALIMLTSMGALDLAGPLAPFRCLPASAAVGAPAPAVMPQPLAG